LIRVVETCNCHPSSKAFFTLCSIHRPTWPPFWSQICNTFHLSFLMTFSYFFCFQSEISLRHLWHIGGKGGTERHLGGIWEASTVGFPPKPKQRQP
jgi:hypothetical protein